MEEQKSSLTDTPLSPSSVISPPSNTVQAPPVESEASVPLFSERKSSSKKKYLLLGSFLFMVTLLVSGVLIYYQYVLKKQTTLQQEKQLSEENILGNIQSTTYITKIGNTVNIKNNLNVRIVESTKEHEFLQLTPDSNEYVAEIENISHSLKDWEKLYTNPLLVPVSQRETIINGAKVQVSQGSEKFASSTRNFVYGTWTYADNTLILRVFALDINKASTIFNDIALGVNATKKTSIRLIKEVNAQEATISSRLPQVEYKEVEVMGEPFETKITKSDPPYKEGFLKSYKFTAFKSQRLSLSADEIATPHYSYVKSQLFDSDGNAVSTEMDTHIEVKIPRTGTYFYLVYTFGQKEGPVFIHIDDHDQMGFRGLIKYSDGAEQVIDNEEDQGTLIGEDNVGFIFEHSSPVVLTGNNLQFISTPRTYKSEPQLNTKSIEVLIGKDLYHPSIERSSTFETANTPSGFKLTRLNANRILITPEEGLFAPNAQVFINGIGSRFFTQKKFIPPSTPIINNFLSDFSADFQKPEGVYRPQDMTALYFDWKEESGTTKEIFGASLFYRKIVTADLADKYKEYLIKKGFTLDLINTYTTTAPSGPYERKIISLTSSDTKCKIVNDTILVVICGK